MKMKMKALAAAVVALGAVAQAHATIIDGSSGNGELFLAVWDDTSKTSYTKDLGVDMNTLVASGNTAGYNLSFNFASDANWTSFVAGAGGTSNMANLQWNVGALDTTGTNAADQKRFLSTSNSGLAAIQTQGNGNIQSGFANPNAFLIAVNATGTHATQANGSSVNAQATDPNSYSGTGGYWGNNWSNKAQGWTSEATGLGTSLDFFYITPSSTSPSGKAKVNQFGYTDASNTFQGAKWSITTDGNLSYAVPASVSPVPVPAALWLFGSAMVGLVGVARRKVA